MSVSDVKARSRVGIVLVNYNGGKFMPDCLESLSRIDYPEARIVIVDNASTDGSADWVAAHYPQIPLLRLPVNRGITGGNNAGMEWCQENGCDHLLLLNNDTVVQPDFLSRLIEQAEPDRILVPKIYFYSQPEVLNSNVGHFDYWRGATVNWFYGRTDSADSRRVRVGTMASTCAMLIPREIARRVGPMDDTYFMYYDDTDYVARAVRLGYRVKFVPESVLYHRESSSSGGQRLSPLTVYYLTRNRLYFMVKHQKSKIALGFFACYFGLGQCVLILRCLRQRKTDLIRALGAAIADFLRGRTGYAPPARFSRAA